MVEKKKTEEPESPFHVVEFAETGARGVVHEDALDGVLAGGLDDLGITSDRSREPVLTDAEWAAEQTRSVKSKTKQPTTEGK